MRALLLIALLALAGCASPPATDEPAPASEPSPEFAHGEFQVGGRYSALKPMGERLQEEGGRTPLTVDGWSNAVATLWANIDLDFVLLPPGCSSTQDSCALRFEAPDEDSETTWEVGDMPAGDWTVVVEAAPEDYLFVDGLYQVRIAYVQP